jgi:hypothetical protein
MHKKLFLAAAALLFTFAAAPADDSNVKTYSGWVSDANCGTSHVGGKNPDCVRKCIKGGAHIGHPEWTAQAMVLVVDETNEILVIDNQDALAGHEAEHVQVKAVAGEASHIKVLELLDAPK